MIYQDEANVNQTYQTRGFRKPPSNDGGVEPKYLAIKQAHDVIKEAI
jgi:hypothetical protein